MKTLKERGMCPHVNIVLKLSSGVDSLEFVNGGSKDIFCC